MPVPIEIKFELTKQNEATVKYLLLVLTQLEYTCLINGEEVKVEEVFTYKPIL